MTKRRFLVPMLLALVLATPWIVSMNAQKYGLEGAKDDP